MKRDMFFKSSFNQSVKRNITSFINHSISQWKGCLRRGIRHLSSHTSSFNQYLASNESSLHLHTLGNSGEFGHFGTTDGNSHQQRHWSATLNEYFLSVFTHGHLSPSPEADQVSMGRENEALHDTGVQSRIKWGRSVRMFSKLRTNPVRTDKRSHQILTRCKRYFP